MPVNASKEDILATTIRQIRFAARNLASDAEICTMLGLEPPELEPHRKMIEAERTGAKVRLKFKRAQAAAKYVSRRARE